MLSAAGILVLIASAIAQDDAVDASLAWGGSSSDTAFTEVSLRANRPVTVSTTSGSPLIGLDLHEGTTQSMPVSPSGAAAVRLVTRTADTAPAYVDAGTLRSGPAPVVLVGESLLSQFAELQEPVVVAETDLPRLASSYSHINALVIEGDSLQRLRDEQLKAVVEHIGNCGRMLLVSASPAVVRMLAQRAGCGRASFHAVQGDAALADELEQLLGRRIGTLPGINVLATLDNAARNDLRLIAVYLFGFLAVFFLLNISRRTRPIALGFCLLVTTSAVLLWNDEPRKSFVAWSETFDGERIARYAALERLTAGTRGEHTLQPASLERSLQQVSGPGLALHWSADAKERQLEWDSSLLDQAGLITRGSFPVEPNLRAGFDGMHATVCNHGAATSPPAYLRWQGSTYAVPALRPAEKWVQHEATPVTARRPELRLLARRMQQDSLALLQPLRVPGNGNSQSAWLMRRESGRAEVSPCDG